MNTHKYSRVEESARTHTHTSIHIIIQHTNETIYMYIIQKKKKLKAKKKFGKKLKEYFNEENLVQERLVKHIFFFYQFLGVKL